MGCNGCQDRRLLRSRCTSCKNLCGCTCRLVTLTFPCCNAFFAFCPFSSNIRVYCKIYIKISVNLHINVKIFSGAPPRTPAGAQPQTPKWGPHVERAPPSVRDAWSLPIGRRRAEFRSPVCASIRSKLGYYAWETNS